MLLSEISFSVALSSGCFRMIIFVVIVNNWLLWFVVSEKCRTSGSIQRVPSRLRSHCAVWVYLKKHPISAEMAQWSHRMYFFSYICFFSPYSGLGHQWATHSLLAVRILLHSVFFDWCVTKLCQKIHHPNWPYRIWIWGKKMQRNFLFLEQLETCYRAARNRVFKWKEILFKGIISDYHLGFNILQVKITSSNGLIILGDETGAHDGENARRWGLCERPFFGRCTMG